MNDCNGRKRDGTPCQARPTAGSRYCFFHDPNKEGQRRKAQRAGGAANKARTLGPLAKDVPLRTPEDVRAFLALSINQLRRGEIDVKIANGIGYLTTVLLKSIDAGEVAERVNHLERVLLPYPTPSLPFDPHPFHVQEYEESHA